MRCKISRISVLAICIAAAAPAMGVTNFGDTPMPGTGSSFAQAPTLVLDGATTDGGWSYEGDWAGWYMGTAIAPQWFASVSHVGSSSTFTYHGVAYPVVPGSGVVINPDSQGQGIEIYKIDGTFPTYAPLWNTGYGGDGNETGLDAVIIGRGTDKGDAVDQVSYLDNQGNTVTGPGGWYWGSNDHTPRWGQNIVSRTSINGKIFLRSSFDAANTGDNTSNGDNEGTLTVGDSGGGLFLYSTASHEWKLAGLNEGLLTGPYSLTSNGTTFNASMVNSRGLYDRSNGGSSLITQSDPTMAVDYEIGSVGTLSAITNAEMGSAIVWTGSASGGWSNAANWWSAPANLVPNASGQPVILGAAITAPTTISLSSTETIGSLQFDNANAYTVSGPGTLTMAIATGSANIIVSNGQHTISAPLKLASSTEITAAAGTSLALTGAMSASSGVTLSADGPGVLQVSALKVDNVAISAGQTQVLPDGGSVGLSIVKSLSITGGASLDLTNNDMIINWSSSNPTATVAALLQSGYDNGKWDGAGLISSAAASDQAMGIGYADNSVLGLSQFDGKNIDATSTLLKYTYFGDANLDGTVNGADLAMMHVGGTTWTAGDFNYDGVVNGDDFALMMLGASEQGSDSHISAAPEPAAGLVAAMAGLILMRRRQRIDATAFYTPRADG